MATTISVRWMGARTKSTVALVLIASEQPRGQRHKGCEKGKELAKGLANPAGEGRRGLAELKGRVWRLRLGLVEAPTLPLSPNHPTS